MARAAEARTVAAIQRARQRERMIAEQSALELQQANLEVSRAQVSQIRAYMAVSAHTGTGSDTDDEGADAEPILNEDSMDWSDWGDIAGPVLGAGRSRSYAFSVPSGGKTKRGRMDDYVTQTTCSDEESLITGAPLDELTFNNIADGKNGSAMMLLSSNGTNADNRTTTPNTCATHEYAPHTWSDATPQHGRIFSPEEGVMKHDVTSEAKQQVRQHTASNNGWTHRTHTRQLL